MAGDWSTAWWRRKSSKPKHDMRAPTHCTRGGSGGKPAEPEADMGAPTHCTRGGSGGKPAEPEADMGAPCVGHDQAGSMPVIGSAAASLETVAVQLLVVSSVS